MGPRSLPVAEAQSIKDMQAEHELIRMNEQMTYTVTSGDQIIKQ